MMLHGNARTCPKSRRLLVARVLDQGWSVALGHRKSQFRGDTRRMTGFEYVHVMVDDYSRLAYAEILPDLTGRSAAQFLYRAVAWFAERGVHIKAVMSDNGSAYIFHTHRKALAQQTLINEWAYARIYGSSAERAKALPLVLDRYNYRRPHGSLSHQPLASRLTNLLRNYT